MWIHDRPSSPCEAAALPLDPRAPPPYSDRSEASGTPFGASSTLFKPILLTTLLWGQPSSRFVLLQD